MDQDQGYIVPLARYYTLFSGGGGISGVPDHYSQQTSGLMGLWGGGDYPSAEVQSANSEAPANRAGKDSCKEPLSYMYLKCITWKKNKSKHKRI